MDMEFFILPKMVRNPRQEMRLDSEEGRLFCYDLDTFAVYLMSKPKYTRTASSRPARLGR